MDGSRFDALARCLAATSTRRGALRSLAAGALGMLGLTGRDEAADAKPSVDCPAGHLCAGKCCVPNVEACCAGKCIDVVVDAHHCHACGKTCASGQICCGNTCRHLQTDNANCGTCGHTCNSKRHCVGGKCVCKDPYIECDGVCVNPGRNEQHCGRCGKQCNTDEGEICSHGKCICPGGGRFCSGDAICGIDGDIRSTRGTCCEAPQVAECCSDSARGAGDGFAHCCTPGVDCLVDTELHCPNGGVGAIAGTCTACAGDCKGLSAVNLICGVAGAACTTGHQCCSGTCHADGTCGCVRNGKVAGDPEACCSRWTVNEFCRACVDGGQCSIGDGANGRCVHGRCVKP